LRSGGADEPGIRAERVARHLERRGQVPAMLAQPPGVGLRVGLHRQAERLIGAAWEIDVALPLLVLAPRIAVSPPHHILALLAVVADRREVARLGVEDRRPQVERDRLA